MKVLNLGCGNKILEGAVNHDLHRHRSEIDVVWDLNKIPWPWADEQFDFINAAAVFEHLNIDLLVSMNECWRLLKLEGTVRVKLPHWNSDLAHQDPTHRWYYSVKSFDQFDPSTERGQRYSFYTPYKWKILQVKMNSARSSLIAKLRVRK